jgi:MerR family mercuric resistance operon transcriptional regulator
MPDTPQIVAATAVSPPLTIGRLARSAEVGVETVRHYTRLKLLASPKERVGAYRVYPQHTVARIRFIKRAQELGFTLKEIAGLLALEDGRDRAAVRKIAGARLAQIEVRLADLQSMASHLRHLLHECEHAQGRVRCPIIAAIAAGPNTGSRRLDA